MTGTYSFTCKESSTEELYRRLRPLRDWSWRLGDSYWYGDYVACVPFQGVRIRIIDFPTRVEGGFRYDADVRIRGECHTSMAEIDVAFRKLLSEIGAQDVEEIEPFD